MLKSFKGSSDILNIIIFPQRAAKAEHVIIVVIMVAYSGPYKNNFTKPCIPLFVWFEVFLFEVDPYLSN